MHHIEVLELNNKAFKPNYKVIYCYCWIKKTTDRKVIREKLRLSEDTVQRAFTFFKQYNIKLPESKPV